MQRYCLEDLPVYDNVAKYYLDGDIDGFKTWTTDISNKELFIENNDLGLIDRLYEAMKENLFKKLYATYINIPLKKLQDITRIEGNIENLEKVLLKYSSGKSFNFTIDKVTQV